MSFPDQKTLSKGIGAGEAPGSAEITLRLVASLPAPDGLEDRVRTALHAAPKRARVLGWPVAPKGEWLRAAAAAAIVFVVAGGGWGIYAHVQPGRAVPAIAGPRIGAPGGFSEGGAVRRPQTLVGPTVNPPAPVVAPQKKLPAKVSATPAPPAQAAAPGKSAARSASAEVR